MLKTFFRIRYMTVLAVIAALSGAGLLLVIGSWRVYDHKYAHIEVVSIIG